MACGGGGKPGLWSVHPKALHMLAGESTTGPSQECCVAHLPTRAEEEGGPHLWLHPEHCQRGPDLSNAVRFAGARSYLVPGFRACGSLAEGGEHTVWSTRHTASPHLPRAWCWHAPLPLQLSL